MRFHLKVIHKTGKITFTHLDDLIKRYQSGETIDHIAASEGVNRKTIYKTFRTASVDMSRKIKLPERVVIERYQSGQSVKHLAEQFNVSRIVINRVLKEHQIQPRSPQQSQKLWMSQTTKEFRQKITENAHNAVRGRTKSLAQKIKNAQQKEINPSNISAFEIQFADMLKERNISFTPQKAVNIYNLDIAIHEPTIAVEIFGGHWHSYGRHAERFGQRTKYLLSTGWHVLIIWVNHGRLYTGSADYLVRLIDQISGNPTLISQYRVITGTGKLSRPTNHNFNDLATIKRLYSGINLTGGID